MVAWLGTPRKPGFGYRLGRDEEAPNTSEIWDVSKGGVVRASTHIDPPMLEASKTWSAVVCTKNGQTDISPGERAILA